jgi:hypothetical protein
MEIHSAQTCWGMAYGLESCCHPGSASAFCVQGHLAADPSPTTFTQSDRRPRPLGQVQLNVSGSY